MRWAMLSLSLLLLTLALAACRPTPRSTRSYDEIRDLVVGRTTDEVARLLGDPDLRQPVLGDERWVWWGYTVLAGEQYAPEVRGRIVHLEITFQNPDAGGGTARRAGEWRVAGPLAVGYSLPAVRE